MNFVFVFVAVVVVVVVVVVVAVAVAVAVAVVVVKFVGRRGRAPTAVWSSFYNRGAGVRQNRKAREAR